MISNAKTPATLYFRPARIKGAPYEVHELQGRPIDVHAVLASLPADEDYTRNDAGSPPPPNDTGSPPPPPQDTESTPSSKIPLEERERRAIAYVAKMPAAISGQNGHEAIPRRRSSREGFFTPARVRARILRKSTTRAVSRHGATRSSNTKAREGAKANKPDGYLLRDNDTSATSPSTPPANITDVLAHWRKNGPLVHEPTGIEALDEVTDGGPVYGSRWGVAGAPDAGKTALAMQVADVTPVAVSPSGCSQ